jgi:hypothetical protein
MELVVKASCRKRIKKGVIHVNFGCSILAPVTDCAGFLTERCGEYHENILYSKAFSG